MRRLIALVTVSAVLQCCICAANDGVAQGVLAANELNGAAIAGYHENQNQQQSANREQNAAEQHITTTNQRTEFDPKAALSKVGSAVSAVAGVGAGVVKDVFGNNGEDIPMEFPAELKPLYDKANYLWPQPVARKNLQDKLKQAVVKNAANAVGGAVKKHQDKKAAAKAETQSLSQEERTSRALSILSGGRIQTPGGSKQGGIVGAVTSAAKQATSNVRNILALKARGSYLSREIQRANEKVPQQLVEKSPQYSSLSQMATAKVGGALGGALGSVLSASRGRVFLEMDESASASTSSSSHAQRVLDSTMTDNENENALSTGNSVSDSEVASTSHSSLRLRGRNANAGGPSFLKSVATGVGVAAMTGVVGSALGATGMGGAGMAAVAGVMGATGLMGGAAGGSGALTGNNNDVQVGYEAIPPSATDIEMCGSCELIVSMAIEHTSKQTTLDDAIYVVHSACYNQPPVVKETCDVLMSLDAQIASDIIAVRDPKAVCMAAGICYQQLFDQ